LDLNRIVAELKSEQERIGKAIGALLEGVGLTGPSKRTAAKVGTRKRRGGITPAGRRRLAAAMKARWAARRAKSPAISAKTTGPKKRGLTAAGRKRLSEAMKKRWAERKKSASKA
jgi:hypothetical protein